MYLEMKQNKRKKESAVASKQSAVETNSTRSILDSKQHHNNPGMNDKGTTPTK